MSKSVRLSFQLPVEHVDEIDRLVPAAFPSREEALRQAVSFWLHHRREAAIDAALENGYATVPPGAEEQSWAGISREGLAEADLDW